MCVNPLIAQRKDSIYCDARVKILGHLRNYSELHKLDGMVFDYRSGDILRYNIDSITGEVLTPFLIPCGSCVECRLNYSREWANRCVMESLSWTPPDEGINNSWFITLTFDDEHNDKNRSPLTGNASLNFDLMQLFIKRLREHYDRHFAHNQIRVYYCGEYGDISFRPHFHLLVFNCPIDPLDLKHIGTTVHGNKLYNVDYISNLWKMGHVVVANLTWDTCAYTARYVMKKQKGQNAKVYEELDIVPEGVRMSRRPGIGLDYFYKHWHEMYYFNDPNDISKGASSRLILPAISRDKPNVGKPPRYFDKKMAEIDLTLLERVKSSRVENAIIHDKNIHKASGLSDKERFQIAEDSASRKNRLLVRKFVDLLY